jgi:2-haloacid dehalogenase
MSNGNVSLTVDMAKRAGLGWDVILGAETARAYKPQPTVYLTGAEMLSLRPEECMMVAAHSSDLEAARDCGLRTAFVRRPVEYGPKRTADDPAGHDFDVVAGDFLDLASQLGC